MNTFVFATLFVAVAFAAAPVDDEAIVDVAQDTEGYYKYTLKSKNITREEERQHDGSIKGFFSYIDEHGERQAIHYTADDKGFAAVGSTIPVDLPEVAEARKQHEVISEKIKSYLPALKSDGTVDEAPEVELTKEEFLKAVQDALNPQYPVILSDTEEVAEAKKEFLKSFSTALEN